MNYEKWYKGTYQNYDDPTEWNGTNPSCKLFEKEKEQHDEKIILLLLIKPI